MEELQDEDFAALESQDVVEDSGAIDAIDIEQSGENVVPLAPDATVYRLRLAYSHETFPAVFPGEPLPEGALVLVPTRYGKDLALVKGRIHHRGPLTVAVRIERVASPEDLEKAARNRWQEADAFKICRQKIALHGLDMKLVSVHYLLEERKILFFFTAESRVDFRDLVKDLVGIFKTRIELRQIGVRDEARVSGGLGVCGRGYCCHTISDKLKAVSIKMAKDQNLSLNSMKISGPCGRLLCCLSYEHGFYSEERRKVPAEGNKIVQDDAVWKVAEVNMISSQIRLSSEDGRQVTLPSSRFEKVEGRWKVKGSIK